MAATMCDYCTLHEMEASDLFRGKGSTVCASCGTRLGGASKPDASLAAAAAPKPSRVGPPPYKSDVDFWCGEEPPASIRDAWKAAADATTARDTIANLSDAIALGCKVDDGALMEDDEEDQAKAAAAMAAAALCAEDQARLYANRATAHLAAGSRMPAANDGRVATEMWPGWWRGHWVRGQALLAGLEGKGPSSFNAGKAEAAGRALQAALSSESLPAVKRGEVLLQAEEAKGMLYSLNPACAQM